MAFSLIRWVWGISTLAVGGVGAASTTLGTKALIKDNREEANTQAFKSGDSEMSNYSCDLQKDDSSYNCLRLKNDNKRIR